MTDSLQDFLQELAEAGDTQGTGAGFTLRSDKAREKLKKFALAHPENYFLLVIAGLHALGGRRFSLRVDADDLQVRADCYIGRQSLANLWESVAGGKEGGESSGLRLLGLAILTTVRFGRVDWTIDSGDGETCHRLRQMVRGEELSEPLFEPLNEAKEGTLVSVKRKDMKTVASRFCPQLTRRIMARDWDEEKLLSERVFLGTMESFEFNRKEFDCRGTSAPVLVVLRMGEGPEILTGKHVFVEKGDLDVVVVLGKSPDIPGEAKKVSWLWHGLTMGDTRLGLNYDFCRAFALADDLRCDLSLTSVADTWARQKAVRLAREAVRRALELAAGRYREIQEGHWPDQDAELEEILLEVSAQRIDVRRNRHRMGSFNDTLLRCPFFQISPPDGKKRRADLFEIWEWIEKGCHPALFREESEWREVESWADRPAVIFGRSRHSRALLQIFGEKAFHRGTAIAQSIDKLVSEGRKFQAPVQPEFHGRLEIDGDKLSWALEFSDRPGGLTVLRDDRVYFEDRGLALPDGFHLFGEVSWEPNFGGRLADEALACRLVEKALRSLAALLDRKSEPPGKKDYQAITSLIQALGPELPSWQKPGLGELEWLVVGPTQEWMSPNQYAALVEQQSLPFYYTTEAQAGIRAPGGTMELPPHLVLSETCLKLLPPDFYDVQGIELLSARPPYELPGEDWISIRVGLGSIARVPDDVTAIGVAFPENGVSDKKDGAVLEMNLRGHKLQTRSYSSFVGPVIVCLDLVKGWPDSRGRHLVDKEQVEALKSLIPDILTQAGRQLWKSLAAEGLERLHPDVQRTVLIDIWSEGESDFEDRILTAGGERVSLAELRKGREIRYFDDWERASEVSPDAIFLTAFQAEALKMTAEVEEFLDQLESAPPAPAPKPQPVVAGGPSSRPQARPPEEVQPFRKRAEPPAVEELQTTALIRNSELPRDHSTSLAAAPPVVASQLEEPQERALLPDLQSPTLERLRELLKALQSTESVPFVREFEYFLSGVREVDRAETLLRAEDGKPVLRRLEDPTQEQLLALLSALYSFFNRTLEVVEDAHERTFHQALVRYACRR